MACLRENDPRMNAPNSSDHFIEIYRHQAPAYQRLIEAEDVDGNLNRTLRALADLGGKRVLDAGAGTGRFAQLLDGWPDSIVSLDAQYAMLAENRRMRSARSGAWTLAQADLVSLPFADGAFEITLCGWAIGHWCAWAAPDWQPQIDRLVSELLRVTASGGWLVIFETMGTGVQQPGPPNQALARYYRRLEEVWGFSRQVISTDYDFESVQAAVDTLAFFFGQELVEEIRRQQWQRVPEFTGVWSRQPG